VRSDARQLLQVAPGELIDDAQPLRSQLRQDLASIVARPPAHEEPLLGETIDQADRAVVLDDQLARQIVDRHRIGSVPQREERMVVLPRHARFLRRGLAEVQETAEGVPEGRKPRVAV
jgi:hypothetical protein